MPLSDYTVPNDKFSLDSKPFGVALDFPCSECQNRHGPDSREPCRSCGHNANAVPPEASPDDRST